ncbi:MAG: glycosyltransferase [Prevotellaceae bacterium]|nr:glycosyltransferase [Prevotellaceae bacterium]
MIGLFNDSYPPIMDGVALTVQNYAYWLHRKNQPVCVVTPKTPEYVDEATYPVYRYASLPLLGRKPYRLGLPYVDIPFQKTIKRTPFKLIHAHCPFSSARVALGLAKQQHIPLVATFHSKFRDDFKRAVNNKQITQWMLNDVIRFFEAADEVWIPQASVEDTIREYGYKGKLEVVNNGTDFSADENIDGLKQQARTALHIPAGMPVFLFVGQHIWEKNTRLIMEALALMSAVPFKMFFIGTGYAAKELQQLAIQHDLQSKVEFLGLITDRKRLQQYYTAADLLLFPSLYDNAPLVVREASAMHTPAILVKDSTAAEIVTDNYNGFLTENASDSLAQRIQTLLKTPEVIKEAGENASKTIARSWNDITEEVLSRYSFLIKKHGNKM